MTNATLPTLLNMSLGGGVINLYVNHFEAIKSLAIPTTASINGTQYLAFKNATGSAYTTPAATNLIFFAIERIVTVIGSAYTVMQIGYDDDGAGTNFVSLFDFNVQYAAGSALSATYTNIITDYSAVPTGKHFVFKLTSSNTTSSINVRMVGLETT